ncbi:MAG TPA: type II toxin-antitoxin system RelE/ParE family toxin [Isosphaeraceae bacterium]|nr:type II toxin-antitoxin system RelE/ParE family toxin [Isosphaeraceae bacterium]
MTYRVILQPRAEREIQRYAYWLLEQSKSSTTASKWVRGIRSKIATLKTNPHRCPVDPDSDAYGQKVHVLLYGKKRGVHRVLFVIRKSEVHILTVRHAAQRSLAEEMGLDETDEEPSDSSPPTN